MPDAPLLAACGRYGEIWARTTRLLCGPCRQRDETRRAPAHQALMREGGPVLAQIAALPARITPGNAARATVVWAWSKGELVGRVLRPGASEDALQAALVADLISFGRIET